MIKKLSVSYKLILTLVVTLTLSSIFLGVERTWADSVIKTIPVGLSPSAISFAPTNGDLYVANSGGNGGNTVSVIDTSTNKVIDTIPVGNTPEGIAFNPNNRDMYVTNAGDNTVYVIATTTPIQPPTATTITPAIDSNGYLVQNGGSTVSRSITFQVTADPGTNPIAGFECSLDVSPFSTCATTNPGRVSYNNLAAGQQHSFEVKAVDRAGNKDPNPATFTWTILTPQQAVQKLTNTIDSMHLSKGITTSLEAPLNAATRQLNRNNDIAACSSLNAFLNHVNQKETKGQLTSQQATDLRQQATAIQDILGCSSPSSLTSSSLNSSISGMIGSIGNSNTIPNIGNRNETIYQQPSSSLPPSQ
jgi:YVTN family beta-propeller protein